MAEPAARLQQAAAVLPGVHAGARERDHGYAVDVTARRCRQRPCAMCAGTPNALAEVRKIEHDAEHVAVERLAVRGIDRVADPDHSAEVQEAAACRRARARRQVPRIAEQRLAVPERTRDDVAAASPASHAAARQLQRVVGGFVLSTSTAITPPSTQGISGATRISRARAGSQRDRRDLVEHDGLQAHLVALRPRVEACPAKPGCCEKPSASALVHSPADSPILAAARGHQRVRRSHAENEHAARARSWQRTSPVTRACDDVKSASMSRQTGSSCLPSWMKSP